MHHDIYHIQYGQPLNIKKHLAMLPFIISLQIPVLQQHPSLP